MSSVAVFSETSSNSYSVKRFIEESQTSNIMLDHFRYSHIEMLMEEENFNILCDGKNILDEYSHFIFRSAKGVHQIEYGFYTTTIKNIISQRGKRVLNDDFRMRFRKSHATKLGNYAVLAENSVPIVKSYNFGSVELLHKNKNHLSFPLIVKRSRGSHGDHVHLVHSIGEIEEIVGEDISMYLIQDFIKTDSNNQEDYRIITLGNEVVGAYKKKAPAGSITTNLGSGGTSESIELTQELVEIGEKVINATGLEFSGIDLIYDSNNRPYVLEVNSAPQFEGFEKATGINLSKKILEYLLSE